MVDAAYWRELSRKRRLDPAYRAKQAEWYKAWRDANPLSAEQKARKAAQMRAYAKADKTRERHAARWAIGHAIAAGRTIKQPCEVCGAEKVHAHHDDYSKPLDVRWLCPPHHREHHAKAKGE